MSKITKIDLAPMTIYPIDTSTWKEFEGFFDKPDTKNVNEILHLAVKSTTFSRAIDLLAQDLMVLKKDPNIQVNSFLLKPSVMEIPPTPSESRTLYGAFCFLQADIDGIPLTYGNSANVGIKSACLSGQVGILRE